MPQVYTTVLKPAPGGFGEWDWIEAVEVEGCEDYFDYEQLLANLTPTVDFEVTSALAGRIHNERGQVYRINAQLTPADRANGLTEGDRTAFEMVWIEDEEL